MARAVFNAVPRPLLEGSRGLRFADDPSLDPAWFAELSTVSANAPLADQKDSDRDWVFASESLAQDRRATSRLKELLRVVGRGFLVLVDGAWAERYAVGASDGPAGKLDSSYGDSLRAALPDAAVLELVVLDGCSLSLGAVYMVSLDQRRLLELAREATQSNIHARLFPPSSGASLELAGSKSRVTSASPASFAISSLPAEFDEASYAVLNPDLARYSGQRLREHYQRHGQAEGRRAHAIADRNAFARLALLAGDVLEIGPSYDPLLEGPRVRTFDVADSAGIREKASALGRSNRRVPHVHYVSSRFDLAIVPEKFDAALSSHVVGCRPDFLGHLAAVRRLLHPGGRYFVLIPDKNYCFQHFLAPSTLAQLLDAHVAGRTRHTLRSQIEHAVLRAHNDSERHWKGDHGRLAPPSAAAVASVVEQHRQRGEVSDNIPAWYFEPASFRRDMEYLRELGETDFSVERLYPTLLNSNEFWAVLVAGGGAK
jgi:SAM-dependent methyltransferase